MAVHLRTEGDLSDVHGDREREVLAQLVIEGGQTRQQKLIDALGWSPAKTSVVLTELHSAGAIVKFEFRGENHVYLPGAAPDVATNAQDEI